MEDQRLKFNYAKKMMLALSTTAILTTAATGAVWDSSAMAATAQPSNTSSERVTHDGVTLTLSDVQYDGILLNFAVQREGIGLPEGMLGNPKREGKGYLNSPEVLINGEQQEKLFGMFGDNVHKRNSAVAEYKTDSLPDEFEMTVRINVSHVKEVFEFKVPVTKSGNTIQVKPDQTKSSKGFSYTVKELTASANRTRLVLDSEGKAPASSKQTGKYAPTMMYYDIVDDQGKVLGQQRLGFYHKKPDTKYHVDELYSAISPNAKSVTIKPYTFTVKPSDWSIVGEKKDSKGKIISHGTKTYIKELEMKIIMNK